MFTLLDATSNGVCLFFAWSISVHSPWFQRWLKLRILNQLAWDCAKTTAKLLWGSSPVCIKPHLSSNLLFILFDMCILWEVKSGGWRVVLSFPWICWNNLWKCKLLDPLLRVNNVPFPWEHGTSDDSVLLGFVEKRTHLSTLAGGYTKNFEGLVVSAMVVLPVASRTIPAYKGKVCRREGEGLGMIPNDTLFQVILTWWCPLGYTAWLLLILHIIVSMWRASQFFQLVGVVFISADNVVGGKERSNDQISSLFGDDETLTLTINLLLLCVGT